MVELNQRMTEKDFTSIKKHISVEMADNCALLYLQRRGTWRTVEKERTGKGRPCWEKELRDNKITC